jgi:hypothetical protein
VRIGLHIVHILVPPLAKYYRNLAVGWLEWVGCRAVSGLEDERAVDGGSEERGVGVPPQGALLACDVELVGEIGRRLDGAVRYHVRPVGPPTQQLKYAMPVD